MLVILKDLLVPCLEHLLDLVFVHQLKLDSVLQQRRDTGATSFYPFCLLGGEQLLLNEICDIILNGLLQLCPYVVLVARQVDLLEEQVHNLEVRASNSRTHLLARVNQDVSYQLLRLVREHLVCPLVLIEF